jgi:PAS domain S-box-containing protein
MKIQAKITTSFLTAFICIFISIALVMSIFLSIAMMNQTFKLIDTASVTKTQHIQTYLNSQKEIIGMLGSSTVFRDFLQEASTSASYSLQKQRVKDRLVRTISTDKTMNELFILNTSGKVVVSTDENHEGADKTKDPYFTKGKTQTYIKDVYISQTTGTFAWAVSTPITDEKSGELQGVVVARLSVDPLFQIVQNASLLGESAEIFLVNSEHYLVTPSLFLGSDMILKKKIETQNIKNCFDPSYTESVRTMNDYSTYHNSGGHKGGVNVYRDYRNIPIVGTHAYIPETKWCLVTKVDEMEIFRPILLMLLLFLGLSCIGVVLFIIISYKISKNITQPLETLQKGLYIIEKGDLEYRVGLSTKDEIGELSRQFDELNKKLKGSRADIDRKVNEQTKQILQKSKEMEDQQKAILNILDDVEIEKKKAELLASDLLKFQLAVENASDHIVITDSEGIVLYANKAVETITGFIRSEIVGKKAGNKELWGGIMDLPFYQLLWKTIKSDKKVFSGEIENHRKNGEKYIALVSVSPILDRNGDVRFFVGIERDVTREKEIDRMKTEFISLASHQLRTPLSAMKWFGEMLLSGDAGALTSDQKEMVGNIYASNERMIELVNSLLNISRIESGRLLIDPKPSDVNVLIHEVVKELEPQFMKQNLTCIVSVHEQLPIIPLDAKLIRQVYINLLTNAIKYSPKGAEIQIIISKNQTDLVSQITDSGFGIPLKEQRRVFEKFFRAQNILKMETEGTGLGLYLVKSIIDSSGGKIWFKSGENTGTTFWFSIPLSGMKGKKGDIGLEEKTISGPGINSSTDTKGV